MVDRFYIGPPDENSGLRTDLKPYLIPDNAYAELTNAYVFRGRVRKRFGSRWTGQTQLSSRLAIQVGTTDSAGDFLGGVPLNPVTNFPAVMPAPGQIFSIGTEIFTITALGNPATFITTGTTPVFQFDATFGVSTGTLVIDGATPLTPIYYYPSLPVMGLPAIEDGNLNAAPNVAFDTKFAYQWNGTMWLRISGELNPGASIWNGSDTQFFWTTTWTGNSAADTVLFVTNDNQNEPNFMRTYFNGLWANFNPLVFQSTTTVGTTVTLIQTYLISALILLPFKNRLLAANIWEQTTTTVTVGTNPPVITVGVPVNYRNRVRSSAVGSPLAVDAWRQDIPGRGKGYDCSTLESLTSMEFVKDRLITFFERSAYEFTYTGNQAYPFSFNGLNAELGIDATFSIVPFDKVAVAIGELGILACNGSNVERIDDKIPDYVFEINNDLGVKAIERVYGIRDYQVEQVYWTIPSNNRTVTTPYPDQILVYNYKTDTWAINEDSITCFGYIQDVTVTGVNWDSTTVNWDSAITWDSGTVTANNRQVIAGNQQGYIFQIDADTPTNAMVLQITNITITLGLVTLTVINHNIPIGSYIYLNGITGSPTLIALNNTIVRVVSTTEPNIIFTDAIAFTGIYTGGGTLARVSNINIKTKEYNFYASKGYNAVVSKIDFLVDRTDSGEITVDYFVSTSDEGTIEASGSEGTNALVGLSTLETFAYDFIPYEASSTRLWRSVYIQAQGECIQLQLTMSEAEMKDVNIMNEDFELHGFIVNASPAGQLR